MNFFNLHRYYCIYNAWLHNHSSKLSLFIKQFLGYFNEQQMGRYRGHPLENL